jgi:hypothetical protein
VSSITSEAFPAHKMYYPGRKYDNGYSKKRIGNRWAYVLYYQCRSAAKRYNRDFNLTTDWIENKFFDQSGKCYYFGVDMVKVGERGNPFKVSLDRMDTELGYTVDNVAMCCLGANFAKNCCDMNLFVQFILAIKSA